jgi:MOSC domain-containing protein YiiM
VLREIVRNREECVGLYATTEAPGMVRVGDPVRLVRA